MRWFANLINPDYVSILEKWKDKREYNGTNAWFPLVAPSPLLITVHICLRSEATGCWFGEECCPILFSSLMKSVQTSSLKPCFRHGCRMQFSTVGLKDGSLPWKRKHVGEHMLLWNLYVPLNTKITGFRCWLSAMCRERFLKILWYYVDDKIFWAFSVSC